LRLTSLLMIPGSETSIPIVGHHELMVGGGSRDPPVVLNDVGRDPDLLFLRSAVLASAGIWSLRVQNATQAMVALDKVSCDLAIVCYTSTKRANNNFSTTC